MTLFDFSQNAAELWRGSNSAARRELLDTVSSNRTLSDASLCVDKRKPSDHLAEGLVSKKIGATGLEPATFCTPCRRASQTAPRPGAYCYTTASASGRQARLAESAVSPPVRLHLAADLTGSRPAVGLAVA